MPKKLQKMVIENQPVEQNKDMLGVNSEADVDVNTAKLTTEAILKRSQEIAEEVKDLSKEEKEAVYSELLKDYGITLKTLVSTMGNLEPGLPPSAIFPKLGWLPLSEMLQRVSLTFDFAELIPYRLIANGLHRIFYREYGKIDHRSAYKQADYEFDPIHNPPGGIVVEEIWKVYMNIHVGFTMWDASLNQNTRSVELFIALFNELEWNITIPVSEFFYRFRMKMIAEDLDFDGTLDTEEGAPKGTDWSTKTPDVTITGATPYEALTNLTSFLIGLNQTSRKNLPARWNPTGMTQVLSTKINSADYVLLVPVAFQQFIDIEIRSGRFNEKYIKLIPEIHAIDYDKSFGEYNADTNYGKTFYDADIRLIPKPSGTRGAWIISQFDAMRTQPNLNLTSVAHQWLFIGHTYHRLTPIFRIKMNATKGGEGGDAITTENFNDTLINDESFKATDTKATTAQSTATSAQETATQLKTDIGDVSTLATTAKTVVPAINEVNAKGA